ncbi:MAG: endonuclease/exonuclease/phosphatase family protein [Cytophagaceae bacterium]|nr:endonuclease/exonuclease/phosphatase family protein [Cytophagaceae bacterium]
MVLLFAGKYISATYAFSLNENDGNLSLLNYNVRVFNAYDHLRDENYIVNNKMIKWVGDHKAGIKCFQEFYHYPSIPVFRTIEMLKMNTPYYYFQPGYKIAKQEFGIAIFSKYPIINKGEIIFQEGSSNQAIFADIKINKDTIRIYNVHLQSMSINEEKLPGLSASQNFAERLRYLLHKLKIGYVFRTKQIIILLEHMEKCPYKIILSGDLNDTPYSYSYQKIKRKLDNAFEEKGNGFGFTYNGKLPFLRIDNVFFDEGFDIRDFKTHYDIKFSDHYPIEASFSF